MIIRNGVRHNTSNFSGSGNANIVKLTQSEYDALPESKKSDGILYAITDGECSASGGSSKPVELTKAEYEALGDKVNSDGILYAITDGDGLTAKSMAYDDSETGLGNTVQDAIDNIDDMLSNVHLTWGLTKACVGSETFNEFKNSYNEYKLMAFDAVSGWWCETTIPSTFLTDEIQYIQAGSNTGLCANFYVSKSGIKLSKISYNGADSTSYSMYVYAR